MAASALDRNADGWYLIADGAQLVQFAELVNAGNPGACALLLDDIDMTGQRMSPIGTADLPYSGTFDGQGHTIHHLTINLSSQDGVGLFGTIQGARLQNFISASTNTITGKAFVGGIVGDKKGSDIAYLTCIGHEGKATGSAQNVAAFVGCIHSGSVVMNACYNTGRVTGNRESAIFCGWFSGSSSSITDCYNSGTLTAGVDGSNYLWRGGPTAINIYDASGRQGGARFSATQRKNGTLAWKLNGEKPDGVYHQNIDNGLTADDHPVCSAVGHGGVFASGTFRCDGTPADATASYSNSGTATVLPHTYAIDGLCSLCQHPDAEFLYTDYQGYYPIDSPQSLVWFAHYVNADSTNVNVSARLTADIDMSGFSFPGIGSVVCPFEGELDGQGHTISGLVINRSGDTGVGLVNVGSTSMLLHDLTLSSSCRIIGNRYVGGFCGRVAGKAGEHIYFDNLGFEGSVTVTDNGGGIVGCVPNNDITAHYTNCYVVGTVNGSRECGSISGWSSNAWLKNCYVQLNGNGWESGADVCRGFTPHFTNCYAMGAAQQSSGLSVFTQKQMTDGTLLKLLNSEAYRQQIGTDAHPILVCPDKEDGIKSLLSDAPSRPVVRYSLTGQPVDARYRGVYILDGRKYFIK